jgi:hypothetical protein
VFGKLSQYSDDLARAIGEPFEFPSHKNTKNLLAQSAAELLNALCSLGVNPEVHHIVEARFSKVLGAKNADNILSVVLPETMYDILTKAWRDEIGYVTDKVAATTANAGKDDIWRAAQKVYQKIPDRLEAACKTIFPGG